MWNYLGLNNKQMFLNNKNLINKFNRIKWMIINLIDGRDNKFKINLMILI